VSPTSSVFRRCIAEPLASALGEVTRIEDVVANSGEILFSDSPDFLITVIPMIFASLANANHPA
jgi:hypothetical protein